VVKNVERIHLEDRERAEGEEEEENEEEAEERRIILRWFLR
jgi:hypothetical protein